MNVEAVVTIRRAQAAHRSRSRFGPAPRAACRTRRDTVLIERWREGTELSAKTGAGMALEDPEERVSWLVGCLIVEGHDYIFASSIVRRGALDPLDAARLAFRTFRARGLV